MDDKSIFIRLLKYWESKGIDGFSYNEFKEWSTFQDDLQSQEARQRARRLVEECCERISHNASEEHFVLKSEYYFRLVEFQELTESRLASKSANRNSLVAIVISVLAIAFSVVASYQQQNAEITIKRSQVAELVKAIELAPKSTNLPTNKQTPKP
jgi:uncharacterized protein HemX